MSAESVANRLLAWAVQNNLIPADQEGSGLAAQMIAQSASPNIVAALDAPEILTAKHLNFIVFNEAEAEVTLYSSRPITKKLRAKLPQKIDDIAVSYSVGGLGAVGRPPAAPHGGTGAVEHNGRYTCGSSIFVANRVSAGTLGCMVRSTTGILYGLSNNHVCGNCSYAQSALPILAPGSRDAVPGGIDPFTIGHHDRSLKMAGGSPHNTAVDHKTNTDAAIFLIRDSNRVTSYQHNHYDTPSLTLPISGGMEVEKVGRTTGRTKGVVRGQVTGAKPVRYKMTEIDVDFHVYFEPMFVVEGKGGIFSNNGDSGSLVTTVAEDGTRYAVGLVFAGDDKDLSFVIPIDPILQTLNMSLVSNHHV